MPYIKSNYKDEELNIYYEDLGEGDAVLLIHGWPLSGKSWEKQVNYLLDAGFRVITYDRRGFGKSEISAFSYEYDALAADLHALISSLPIDELSLVGFSMGGGEVIRYLTNYPNNAVKKIALISSIIPLVKQKDDNPQGVPEKDLEDIAEALKTDRINFLPKFHQGFYNYSESDPSVSKLQLKYDFSISSQASSQATYWAAKAWMDTDFREEAKKIDIPTLIIHGDADQTVPIETAGQQAAELIKNATFHIYKQASHGLNITHAEQLNKDLDAFLKS